MDQPPSTRDGRAKDGRWKAEIVAQRTHTRTVSRSTYSSESRNFALVSEPLELGTGRKYVMGSVKMAGSPEQGSTEPHTSPPLHPEGSL